MHIQSYESEFEFAIRVRIRIANSDFKSKSILNTRSRLDLDHYPLDKGNYYMLS
jgi:hypothetical protein